MSDNISITSGTGVTVATDDDGAAQHQYVKIEFGADGVFTKVTNAVPMPISGTTIAITSLPDLGLGSSVKITSLPAFAVGSSVTISNLATVPLTVSGTTIAITSLPDLGLNSSVKITSLPDLGLNSSVKITSLPPLGAATVSVNNFTFVLSITNLASTPLTVSGTTIAITSLPPIPIHSISNGAILSISPGALVSVSDGAIVSISNGAIFSISGLTSATMTVTNAGIFQVQIGKPTNYWRFTSTYTSAQTNVVLLALGTVLPSVSSTTAAHVTDVIFSNSSTQGNFSLVESRSYAAIRVLIAPIYNQPSGGMVANFATPLVLDTNAALCMTTLSVTAHSVTVSGYTAT